MKNKVFNLVTNIKYNKMIKYQYSWSTAWEDDDYNLHLEKHIIQIDEATNVLLDKLYDEVSITTNNRKTLKIIHTDTNTKSIIELCRYPNGYIEQSITIDELTHMLNIEPFII